MIVKKLNCCCNNMTADEIVSQLETQYKDDPEAIETIERAKDDLVYIKGKKYNDGQSAEEYALSLAGHLALWS